MRQGANMCFGVGSDAGGAPGWPSFPVLESDGSQFIDTGIAPRKGLVVTCRFQPATWAGVTDWGTYFGTGVYDESLYNILGRHYRMDPNDFNPWFGNDYYGTCVVPADQYLDSGGFSTVVLSAGGCQMTEEPPDGIELAWHDLPTASNPPFTSANMFLFAANDGDGAPWRSQPCRIAYFSVNEPRGGGLLLELVPARDEFETLCMRDQVSGSYYYNLGSGSFTGNI